MAGLIWLITTQCLQDTITFINSSIFEFQWMSTYVLANQDKGSITPLFLLRDYLVKHIKNLTTQNIMTSFSAEVCTTLRGCCGLMGLLGLKLSNTEAEACIELITKCSANTTNSRAIKLGQFDILLENRLLENRLLEIAINKINYLSYFN